MTKKCTYLRKDNTERMAKYETIISGQSLLFPNHIYPPFLVSRAFGRLLIFCSWDPLFWARFFLARYPPLEKGGLWVSIQLVCSGGGAMKQGLFCLYQKLITMAFLGGAQSFLFSDCLIFQEWVQKRVHFVYKNYNVRTIVFLVSCSYSHHRRSPSARNLPPTCTHSFTLFRYTARKFSIPSYHFFSLPIRPLRSIHTYSRFAEKSNTHISFQPLLLLLLFAPNNLRIHIAMPSQTPPTGNTPITYWFCGNCRKGPMTIKFDFHCVFCFRQKDCYAYYDPPSTPPKR